MTAKILHMMVGLPRSGKSTAAKQLGYPIVSLDAIRFTMHGTYWKPELEPLLWGMAHVMVDALFLAGHSNVTLDSVNHTHERRMKWTSDRWSVQYHVIDPDEETCIRRAKDTDKRYLIPVIKRMAAQWEPLEGPDC